MTAFASVPTLFGSRFHISSQGGKETGAKAFLFKKVKKSLHVKKKCVPLQSQFEEVRIRPEMGQRIDSLAQ